jgi:predicted phage-related endonuclease
MKRIDLAQGSPEWKAYRNSHFNASDAPKMMGMSTYKSRNAFIKQYLLARDHGIEEQFTDWLLARFEMGHEAEAKARPIACEIAGDDLFPVVAEIESSDFSDSHPEDIVTALSGKLSASFDGLSFDQSVIWEHKLWNDRIGECISRGVVPEDHRIQMEQQLMISGAERGLFMASDGQNMGHVWCEPDMELRARILDCWMQFAEDLDSAVNETLNAAEDAKWMTIERSLMDAEVRLERAKKDVEMARQKAIEYSGGRRVMGSGYNLSYITRSGSIAYAKAFKELGIDADLEPYRGKPTQVVQIKRNSK